MVAGDPLLSSTQGHDIQRALEQVLHTERPRRVALLGAAACTLVEAAAAHASVVYLVTDEPDTALSERAARLGAHLHVLVADPARARLPERVDVAVIAPPGPWMLEGPEAAIVAHAVASLLAPDGLVIPARVAHIVELVTLDDEDGQIAVLSEGKHVVTTELADLRQLEANNTMYVRPLLRGLLNGLRLHTLVELADGIVQRQEASAGAGLLVPLREALEVDAGHTVALRWRYTMGQGLEGWQARARLQPDDEPPLDAVLVEAFCEEVEAMIDDIERRGRGADLDKVVSYTLLPHGDVSRLTALSWTVDEDYQGPLLEMINRFRSRSAAKGYAASDDEIYALMLEVYRQRRQETE